MNVLLAFVLSAFLTSRLNDEGMGRVIEHREIVEKVSAQYAIPDWIIWGIAYNETNFQPLVGDKGKSWGIGQVRCSDKFSWIPFLHRTGAKKCRDLLIAEINIQAIAIILNYNKALMIERDEFSWRQVIRAYNLGNKWRTSKRESYYVHVKALGYEIEERLRILDLYTQG